MVMISDKWCLNLKIVRKVFGVGCMLRRNDIRVFEYGN